jgi:hypothetical protein
MASCGGSAATVRQPWPHAAPTTTATLPWRWVGPCGCDPPNEAKQRGGAQSGPAEATQLRQQWGAQCTDDQLSKVKNARRKNRRQEQERGGAATGPCTPACVWRSQAKPSESASQEEDEAEPLDGRPPDEGGRCRHVVLAILQGVCGRKPDHGPKLALLSSSDYFCLLQRVLFRGYPRTVNAWNTEQNPTKIGNQIGDI